jgi:phosphoglycerate dehydrogenase-like enzyme
LEAIVISRPCVAILDDYEHLAEGSPSVATLRQFADVRLFQERIAPADLPGALAGCDTLIAIRERTRFTPELLASLTGVRHLAQTGAGVAHIDVKAATAQGIAVSVTPGGSAQAVAELTLALLLAVVHRVAEGDRAIRAGQWPPLLGAEVGGKTLGLIGLGTIGQDVARLAQAFGMRVLAWSPHLTPERAQPHAAEAVALEELLAQSDVVSIHIRLSDQTRGLLHYDRLRQMKPGAVLINTSRGPIAPGGDLVRALQEGILGGAGLDVFDQEPLPPDHPIRSFANVVLTPHVGWTTRETYERFFAAAVANVRAWAAGAPANVLNPEVLQAGR